MLPVVSACRKWVEEKAKNQVLESKLVNAATYEVLVKTGSMKGAATDARVYIELYGPDFCASPTAAAAAGMTAGVHMQQTQQQQYGASAAGMSAGLAGVMDCCGGGGEVRLFDIDSHAKPFQKGAADSFTVLCHNVGLPARLKVWHDNTGCHPDWFLAEVKVRKKGSKDWVCFPCNRWAVALAVFWGLAGVFFGAGTAAATVRMLAVLQHAQEEDTMQPHAPRYHNRAQLKTNSHTSYQMCCVFLLVLEGGCQPSWTMGASAGSSWQVPAGHL